jgi:hypothetical protein
LIGCGFAEIAAVLMMSLQRPNDRSQGVSDIDWDEEVQVLEPSTFGDGDVLEGGRLFWDRISLAEAVERCMGLPPDELARVNILATSACYGAQDIETLYERRDFPHSAGLN